MKDIKSLTLPQLKMEMEALGEKAFRAKQLYEWMHVKLARSYEEMTNIPKSLIAKCEEHFVYTGRLPRVADPGNDTENRSFL